MVQRNTRKSALGERKDTDAQTSRLCEAYQSPIPVCKGESSSCGGGGEEDGMRSEGAAAPG